MRDIRLRHIWLLLALVLGQALFALHAAEHPLTSADYDCVACSHGFDGQQALGTTPPAVPAVALSIISAPPWLVPCNDSPAPNRPPIRGPPSNLV